MPGEAPGIYACDYKKLAQIHSKVAEGRVELLKGNPAEAEVTPTFHTEFTHRRQSLTCVTVEMRSWLPSPVLTAGRRGDEERSSAHLSHALTDQCMLARCRTWYA